MADPERSTAAAAIAAASLSGVGRAPGFYGGGPVVPTGVETPVLRAALDYLVHHPHERSGLSEALRAILLTRTDHDRSKMHYVPLNRHGYPLGSVSLETALATSNPIYSPSSLDCGYGLLEAHRSDVASLARFSQRVDHATFYLFVAVDHFADRLPKVGGVAVRRRPKSWYGDLARQCFARWKTTRELLVQDWPLPETSEPLYRTAFWSLCELTPADSQLKQLFEQDRFRASRELVRHVDAYADQLALAADLAQTMAQEEDTATVDPVARLDAIQQELLDKAGERLTLTEAAERLGISRQALHKKIKTGAALGLMIGETFVLPAIQLVQTKNEMTVVAHLRDVLSLFAEAGSWSALQYLIEPDPVLGGAMPLDRLKAGDAQTVVAATRAYLGLDEG